MDAVKCRICGYRANSIKGMGEHYRRKHPSAMKRTKRPRPPRTAAEGRYTRKMAPSENGQRFCPYCGSKIGG